MPRRLLREPHLLAHELRTPLGLLAGWQSLIDSGDVDRVRTPDQWKMAMEACDRAIRLLNLIIREACDEAGSRVAESDYQRYLELLESTQHAITRSKELMTRYGRRSAAR